MHLEAASHAYPQAWKMVDQFRAARGTADFPNWPEWCFMPMAGFYSIVAAGVKQRVLDRPLIGDIGRLTALGTWRVTQGIYRFDPSLFDAIISTPVDGNLPCDVLYRLPEWCVYIETPNTQWLEQTLFGIFVHLECDANTQRHELRLVFDCEVGLQSLPLHLGDWPLTESVVRMTREAARYTERQSKLFGVLTDATVASNVARELQPIISLVLYLCSANSEIGDGYRKPGFPTPKKTKSGWRLFAAERPTTWDVGVRMGAALRRAYQRQDSTPGVPQNSLRPHIRRAHWHGFWSGPKNTPAERKLALQWLPPIPVNLTDTDQLVPVIRPID